MKKRCSLIAVVVFCLIFTTASWGAKDVKDILRYGTVQEVRAALLNGLDPKSLVNDKPILLYAANTNTPEVVSFLIQAGADVNAKGNAYDSKYETALTWAAVGNTNPEVLSILLKAGADVNAKDRIGKTALMYAAEYNGNPEVLSVLLKAGADVNAKDPDGETALMWALNADRLTFMKSIDSAAVNLKALPVLLKAGADVNAKGRYGHTVLWHAEESNAGPEVFSILLKAGAKVTNSDLAEARNNDVFKILLAAMTQEAQSGDPEALYQLGLRYSAGDGVKQDDKKAVEFFRKAAQKGHKKAKEALKLFE